MPQILAEFSWPLLSIYILVFATFTTTLILWRRYLSRRQLKQRVAELEILSGAGRAIVDAELDVGALSALIAKEAAKIIDTNTFQVGLFSGHLYEIQYWCVNGRLRETPQTFDLKEGHGLVSWVHDTRMPLLVHDFEREMALLPAKPNYVSGNPPRSALFIPLIRGEQTIGIVAAQNDQPNCFSEEDLRRLMILSNQAAAAIANARLYEQERMRAAHLELVGKIARQVNAVQELDEIFNQVVHLTRETFGFHPVNIFGLDSQNGDALLEASSVTELLAHKARLSAGRGLVGTAVAMRQTIVVNDTRDDERFVTVLEDVPQESYIETRSEITIPLIVNDNLLGVLDVQSSHLNAFTPSEQTVLEALAAEVGSAIHKAQQLAWQQAQAWATTAQLQVAEALSRSKDLDEMVTAVARLTPMLTGAEFCSILLWDDELDIYRGAALYIPDTYPNQDFSKLEISIGNWHALDAVHVGQSPLTTRQIPKWLASAVRMMAIDAVYLLPLGPNGQTPMQGMLIVDDPSVDLNGNGRDLLAIRRHELLQNIAQQTAQAVNNARLRIAQQEEAWVNTALLQVAEAVNSLIDLNEILGTVMRLVPLLVGVESAMILIWDEEQQLFTPGPSHGISEMGLGLLETLHLDHAEFRHMTSATVSAQSANFYEIRLPDWLETVLASPFAYALPLNAQSRLVGVMIVGMSADSRVFSARRLNILNGIAQQAATAVVNNQLYKESADRARLQQELDVARNIQASFLPDGSPKIPGCSVASYWQAARQVSGDFYDFMQRADGSWGIVIADVADKGVPAALFMALSRTILRTVAFNRDDPAKVLMRTNSIINSETQTDLFVTVFYAVWYPDKKMLVYANGGHNPPLLLRRNGEIELLKAPGIALGVLPEIQIPSQTIYMKRGDTLLLYTDGVTEAINEDYDEFGMERLNLTARAVQKLDATGIINAIQEGIHDHAGGTAQFDDITMVVMKRM
ncbi:MAG: SpoIIE family protein phosphatase [Anaerolineales bacterium]|nr:SpoIIE family protein phosphatase [Anaerolineales bacterium]